jgi:hypothetical protein
MVSSFVDRGSNYSGVLSRRDDDTDDDDEEEASKAQKARGEVLLAQALLFALR